MAQEHAKKYQSEYSLAAETILKSTYMDDSMDSVPDVKTAIELYNQLSELWGSARMYARKWLSNEPEVLRNIPSSDCATEVDLDRVELPQVKSWEFFGALRKMYLSFKSTSLLRNMTKRKETS